MYVRDTQRGFGFAPAAAAAVAQAAPSVIKGASDLIGGLFGKPKTIAAKGDLPGLYRLGQDGSSFTLVPPAAVTVIAPNGTTETQTVGPGTFKCSSFLGKDLQKGASKACYLQAAEASAAMGAPTATAATVVPPGSPITGGPLPANMTASFIPGISNSTLFLGGLGLVAVLMFTRRH